MEYGERWHKHVAAKAVLAFIAERNLNHAD
jgi:hypothetical protein